MKSYFIILFFITSASAAKKSDKIETDKKIIYIIGSWLFLSFIFIWRWSKCQKKRIVAALAAKNAAKIAKDASIAAQKAINDVKEYLQTDTEVSIVISSPVPRPTLRDPNKMFI